MGPIPYPPPGDGDPSDSGNVDDSDLPGRWRLKAAAALAALLAVTYAAAPVAAAHAAVAKPADVAANDWKCADGASANIYNDWGNIYDNGGNFEFVGSGADLYCVKPSPSYLGFQYIQDYTSNGQHTTNQCMTWAKLTNQYFAADCGRYPAAQSFTFMSQAPGVYNIYNYYAGNCVSGNAVDTALYGYTCGNQDPRRWQLFF